MATYTINESTIEWQSSPIYGSSRLGTYEPAKALSTNSDVNNAGHKCTWLHTPLPQNYIEYTVYRGLRRYELSNHLGNVLVVISDKRSAVCSGGDIDHYEADVIQATDYYCFGSPMFGRVYQASGTGKYRYGFNGKEADNEINVDGGSYDFGARIYDGRLGRWLSVDPLMTKYPNLSPYNAFENNPIYFNDPDGMDAVGKVEGNTITISTTIYIAGSGATKMKAIEMQNQVMQIYGKGGTYSDGEKTYNVKFDIQIKVFDKDTKLDESSNTVFLNNKSGKDFRSKVANFNIGIWSNKESKNVYAHEVGHFLGLADQYVDLEPDYDGDNSAYYGNNRKKQSVDYDGVDKAELMGSGMKKITKKDIDNLAKFVLENQKGGKAVINKKTLDSSGNSDGLGSPTIDQSRDMESKAQGSGYNVVKPK